MTPEQYRRALDLIVGPVAGLVLGLALRVLSNGQSKQRQQAALVAVLLPTMQKARQDAAKLADQFFRAQAAAQGAHNPLSSGAISAPRQSGYTADAIATALEDSINESQSSDEAATTFASTLTRHVEAAARETVIRGTETNRPDGARVRWARQLTGADNCAFCVMLASRGAVYGTAEAAGKPGGKFAANVQNTFHNNCDCLVVPVFDTAAWPGAAQADELYALWKSATKGFYQRDAMNALRRYLNSLPDGGTNLVPNMRVTA